MTEVGECAATDAVRNGSENTAEGALSAPQTVRSASTDDRSPGCRPPEGTIARRLYRGDCVLYRGGYVKDLSRLGRRLRDIVIVDNSPMSYALQPRNAVPCTSFIDDRSDTELYDIVKVLEQLAAVENVRRHMNPWQREWRRRVRRNAKLQQIEALRAQRAPQAQ